MIKKIDNQITKDVNKIDNNSEQLVFHTNEVERKNLTDNDFIREYIKKISQFPILTKEEEDNLLDEYFNQKNKEAGKKIILSHLKLVLKIALQYKNYGLPMVDILSEGNTGLSHALQKFKINNNNRFSTYAMLWIKAYIQDFILRSWSLVKIGSVALRKKMLFNFKETKKILDNNNKNKDNNKDENNNEEIKDIDFTNVEKPEDEIVQK